MLLPGLTKAFHSTFISKRRNGLDDRFFPKVHILCLQVGCMYSKVTA